MRNHTNATFLESEVKTKCALHFSCAGIELSACILHSPLCVFTVHKVQINDRCRNELMDVSRTPVAQVLGPQRGGLTNHPAAFVCIDPHKPAVKWRAQNMIGKQN